MKGYVVTLLNVPQSVTVANRCVASGKQFDIDVELFEAIEAKHVNATLIQTGLKVGEFDPKYSRRDAVIANFLSQYLIWQKINQTGNPAIVLEHDAVFVNKISTDLVGDIINLGKPSYGKYNKLSTSSQQVAPLFSKKGGYFPGAHGYYVTPEGANKLISKAKEQGCAPCDIFLNVSNFPDLKELYPWVVEAHDSFSTIQNVTGCLAKHNYNKDYQLI